MARSLTAIDLFSGCGGMSSGARMGCEKVDVRYALDFDAHACSTFKANHPDAVVAHKDVGSVTAREILDSAKIDRVDYLFTGPSCQAVSTMGLFYAEDPRNLLFVHLARLISEMKKLGTLPRNIVLENVPGLVFKSNRRLVRDLFEFFSNLGYRVGGDVLSVATYGVPQLRFRFFMLATLEDKEITLPRPRHADEVIAPLSPYVTVEEAISDLYGVAPIDGDGVAKLPRAQSAFQRRLRREGKTYNHWVSATQEINLARVSHVPQGGSWKDIPSDLLPARFQKVRMTDYHTLYGRLHEKNPAYTITAQFGNVTTGCFTHPLEDRPLSVREGCRLQGFSDDFRILGPKNSQYRQVGNAVPPLLMASLMEHWTASKEKEFVRPRITLDALESGQSLPVLTPRFKSRQTEQETDRAGYGSGTFWPRGWGERALHKGEILGYRKTNEPFERRRTVWRSNKVAQQVEFADYALKLDISEVSKALRSSRHWIFQPLGGTLSNQQVGKHGDLAFTKLVAQTLAVARGLDTEILIVPDFSYTRERILQFKDLIEAASGTRLLLEVGEVETARQLRLFSSRVQIEVAFFKPANRRSAGKSFKFHDLILTPSRVASEMAAA